MDYVEVAKLTAKLRGHNDKLFMEEWKQLMGYVGVGNEEVVYVYDDK